MWPDLELVEGPCAHQIRGSDDCGIHMTAIFFAVHLRAIIRNTSTLGIRLRPFLARVKETGLDKRIFLTQIGKILSDEQGDSFEGGAPPPKKRGRPPKPKTPERKNTARTTAKTPKKEATNLKEKKKTEQPNLAPSMRRIAENVKITRTTKSIPETQQKKTFSDPMHQIDETNNKCIDIKIKQILDQEEKIGTAIASRQLCYFFVSTAMVNVGDGGKRSLELDSLANQAIRKGFKSSTQYDVGETLAAYGKELDFLMINPSNNEFVLLERPRKTEIKDLYVQAPDSTTGLPNKLLQRTFRIGAKYTGDVVQHRIGLSAGVQGHYSLTVNPNEAVFGVYLPETMTHYQGTQTTRLSRKAFTVDKAPDIPRAARLQRAKAESKTEETDLESKLKEPVPAGLNAVGLRQEGVTTSPEAWYVYQDKPPFVQKTAWEAKTQATRKFHIRWLNEIKAMPKEFLSRELPHAIMEFVRWIAVKRRWKWATYAKNLSTIEAALESLPLYTNQKKGISLKDCPEWKENLAGAQLKEHESEAEPPEPVTIGDFEAIRQSLELQHPTEALFLTLMWMFAARPADISRLRVRDITFQSQDKNGNVPIQLTIREGKAVKFRGPYPVSSILPIKYASLLQQMMKEKERRARIFHNPDEIRARVLAEVQKKVPKSTLSSLRKGAAMHLAKQGVPEEELMRLTGHTQLKTLRKYLQYGLQPTAEDVAAQGNASLLLPQPSS